MLWVISNITANGISMTDIPASEFRRLEKLAERYELTGYLDQLRKSLKPGFSVQPAQQREKAKIISKFGGLPDAPPGFRWPKWEFGFMHFVAQIKLSELPTYCDELPRKGYLLFFASGEGTECKVFWYSDTPPDLEVAEVPPESEFTYSCSEKPIFEPCLVKFVVSTYLPPTSTMGIDDDDVYYRMMDLKDELEGGDSRLLGYSYYDPGDSGLEGGFKKWEPLLQVDSFEPCNDMLWLDNGKLAYFVRKGCVKRAAFGRLRSVVLGAG